MKNDFIRAHNTIPKKKETITAYVNQHLNGTFSQNIHDTSALRNITARSHGNTAQTNTINYD